MQSTPACPTPPFRSGGPLALVAGLLGLLGLPVPAPAEQCAQEWTRPVACSMEIYGGPSGERVERLRSDRIELPVGGTFELELEARDQRGRSFPEDRLAFGVDVDSHCDRLVEVDETDGARFRIRARSERGACTVWLWVPGNLNLERRLDVEVVGRSREGYSRAEAEYIAQRLYAGLLGREPDDSGFQRTTVEIQRGNLGHMIRSIVGSDEFRGRRGGLTAAELLDQFYRGILDRSPDSAGVRTFLRAIERGDYDDVAWELVRSQEFEQRLVEEAGS